MPVGVCRPAAYRGVCGRHRAKKRVGRPGAGTVVRDFEHVGVDVIPGRKQRLFGFLFHVSGKKETRVVKIEQDRYAHVVRVGVRAFLRGNYRAFGVPETESHPRVCVYYRNVMLPDVAHHIPVCLGIRGGVGHVDLAHAVIVDHVADAPDVVGMGMRCDEHVDVVYVLFFKLVYDRGVLFLFGRVDKHGVPPGRDEYAVALADVDNGHFERNAPGRFRLLRNAAYNKKSCRGG